MRLGMAQLAHASAMVRIRKPYLPLLRQVVGATHRETDERFEGGPAHGMFQRFRFWDLSVDPSRRFSCFGNLLGGSWNLFFCFFLVFSCFIFSFSLFLLFLFLFLLLIFPFLRFFHFIILQNFKNVQHIQIGFAFKKILVFTKNVRRFQICSCFARKFKIFKNCFGFQKYCSCIQKMFAFPKLFVIFKIVVCYKKKI